MLGADVVVAEETRFLLREHDDVPRPVGEPFEHGQPPQEASGNEHHAADGLPALEERVRGRGLREGIGAVDENLQAARSDVVDEVARSSSARGRS